MSRSWLAVGAIAVLAIVTAVIWGRAGASGPAYRTDTATTTALRKFSLRGPQGATLRLAEATTFLWDRVQCFPEGSKREDVRAALGVDLFQGQKGRLEERGPLLVFTRAGAVVEAVALIPPLFLSCKGAAAQTPDTAVLRAHSKPPGPYLLVLEGK